MTRITIDEFKHDPNGVVARAEAGETIEIVRAGVSVIEVRPRVSIPARDAAWHAANDRLQELLARPIGRFSGKITHEDKYGDAAL